ADIGMGDPWNEFLVSNLIYDMLSALKDDIENEKINHPLREMILPVVNREMFIKELESRGYAIKGDIAMRQPGAAGGLPNILPDVLAKPMLPGAITNALSRIIKDKITIPEEATVDEFIKLARSTLERLPGYPPGRTQALQGRVRAASVEARTGASRKTASAPRQIKTPAGNISYPQPTKKKAGWMQDFITAHRTEGSAKETRLTNLSHAAESIKQVQSPTKATPNWKNDFEKDSREEKKEERAGSNMSQSTTAKPEWMKDFE
ncbi:MAG: hypothetical protein K2Z81_20930, partial [Cyanobacteria bacterium]|nr:hypothetical protein [Cyanobacteriota bacterium]